MFVSGGPSTHNNVWFAKGIPDISCGIACSRADAGPAGGAAASLPPCRTVTSGTVGGPCSVLPRSRAASHAMLVWGISFAKGGCQTFPSKLQHVAPLLVVCCCCCAGPAGLGRRCSTKLVGASPLAAGACNAAFLSRRPPPPNTMVSHLTTTRWGLSVVYLTPEQV